MRVLSPTRLVACMSVPFWVVMFGWQWLSYRPPIATPYFSEPRAFVEPGEQRMPMVIAHQGGDGLMPGNTLETLRHANALGVDVLEMDVHASADGQLVLLHDDTVDRTTNGTGRARDMTLAQLQSLDAGYRWPYEGGRFPFRGQGIVIPRLQDVLSEFPQARFNIELKQLSAPDVAALCVQLRGANAGGRTLVASFHAESLGAFRAACPEVPTSATPAEVRWFVVLSRLGLTRLYRSPAHVFQVPRRASGFELLTPDFIADVRARGIFIDAWTINTREELRQVARLGVTGVITDRPDLALAVRTPPARNGMQ